MRGERNDLGALRDVADVEGMHFEVKTGAAIVRLKDGTFFRIQSMTSWNLRKEADRLELRAKVMRAIATNMEGAAQ